MAQIRQRTPEERIKFFDEQNQKRFISDDAILVFREKHGNIYFSIKTLDALYATALAVLKGRFDEGWFYEPEKPEDLGISLEDIERTANSAVRLILKNQYDAHQKNVDQYNSDMRDHDMIVEAIKTKNGRLAWEVIRDHHDYEYEGWEVENLIKPEDYRNEI